jgi:hypothetical protein
MQGLNVARAATHSGQKCFDCIALKNTPSPITDLEKHATQPINIIAS